MVKKNKYYGISCDGELMSVYISGNDDIEFCNSYSAILERSSCSPPWLNTSINEVNMVFSGAIVWYNSSIETPELKKEKGSSYKIVEVKLKVEKL